MELMLPSTGRRVAVRATHMRKSSLFALATFQAITTPAITPTMTIQSFTKKSEVAIMALVRPGSSWPMLSKVDLKVGTAKTISTATTTTATISTKMG